MKAIVDICLIPIGVGTSLSDYIAACQDILTKRGLKTAVHAYGTNVEGDLDEIMEAIKECHAVVHRMGAPRISTSVKIGTRTDRQQSMQDKVESVEQKMKKRRREA